MTTIAARELRNHTGALLARVAAGERLTITHRGEPVAELTRPGRRRRGYLQRDEVLAVLAPGRGGSWTQDQAWIGGGSTDDLGPLR